MTDESTGPRKLLFLTAMSFDSPTPRPRPRPASRSCARGARGLGANSGTRRQVCNGTKPQAHIQLDKSLRRHNGGQLCLNILENFNDPVDTGSLSHAVASVQRRVAGSTPAKNRIINHISLLSRQPTHSGRT